MTPEQFRTIGDHLFHGATVVALSCGAEPLMARHFGEILLAMGDYRVPSTEMVTNGMLLDESHIASIIEARLSRVIVSVDGATAPTYESIRRGAKFDTLLRNLQLLREMKRERRATHPIVRFNFVMMRRNIRELPALIELAADCGATQVTAQHALVYEGCISEDESLYRHQRLTSEMLIQAHHLAARSGIVFNAPPLFSSARPTPKETRWLLYSHLVTGAGIVRDFGPQRLRTLVSNVARRKVLNRGTFCHHPWEVMFLDLEGNVRPCINWTGEAPLGNAFHQTMEQLIDSVPYAQLRSELTGTAPLRNTCLHCPALASGKVDEATAFEQVPL
jgi:MoaA/NifB/PqqE/SkfB family radical SAM enzyme